MDERIKKAASDRVETFIARWQGHEGGQERANYGLFLTELCDVLDLPHPDVANAFRGSKNLAKNIAEVLASLARLGHVATKDGKSFEIRRVA